MDTDRKAVDYLTKVTLDLEAGSQADHMDLTNSPVQYTFVFGVAAHGITAFEKALYDGTVGDEQIFEIKKENAYDILGYLRFPLLNLLSAPLPYFLKARISHIAQAESREVVAAMAATVNECGDDCDCGCGCG